MDCCLGCSDCGQCIFKRLAWRDEPAQSSAGFNNDNTRRHIIRGWHGDTRQTESLFQQPEYVMKDYYKSVLDSLYDLLDSTGVTFWADWIGQDIRLWEQEKSVVHHLESFGGMGSFNDVWICAANGRSIQGWQEPWANTLLEELKSLSYLLAKHMLQNTDPDIHDIRKEFLQTGSGQLHGSRCLACGFSALSEQAIDNYIAPQIIHDEIINGLENNQLNVSVIKCVNADFQIAQEKRSRIKEMMNRSHISYRKNNAFMRPCDQCGSDDTAVYRWTEVPGKNPFRKSHSVLVPSKDNLPLRRK
jgi:hypothetical protein